MGLMLALYFGFFIVMGLSHQHPIEKSQPTVIHNPQQAKKNIAQKMKAKPNKIVALFDGIEVRLLKDECHA